MEEHDVALSAHEIDLLLRLLDDEVGREWRHDRHAEEDVVELRRKLVRLRDDWAQADAAR